MRPASLRIQPFGQHRRTRLLTLRHLRRGSFTQRRDVGAALNQFDGVADQPGFDAYRIDLGMKLRRALTSMLNMERGLDTRPEGLCLVRGSQMGIYLAARVLVRPGDCVAFERPSYGPAHEAFRACGATIHSIAQDEHGLLP